MKTIPVLILSAISCLSLPQLSRGQALPFQQSPPPGAAPSAPVPVDATVSNATTSAVPDGFVMRDGVVYTVKGGALTRVTQEQVLRIAPNGTITGFDGKTFLIPAGQMLTSDGRVVPVDPALLNDPARARAADTVTGENRSGLAPAGSGQPSTTTTTPSRSERDAFSGAPDTRGTRATGSMRGSGTNTAVDPNVPGVVIDGQPATTNNQPTGTTNTNNQRTGNGTNVDPNATGSSSSTTPNQVNSSGTNAGANARTTTPRESTPNQQNSGGTATQGTSTNTNNPNAVRSGSASGSGTSATSPSGATSGTSGPSTGDRSTTGGGTSSTSGTRSGTSRGSGGASGSSGGSSGGTSGSSAGGGASGGAVR